MDCRKLERTYTSLEDLLTDVKENLSRGRAFVEGEFEVDTMESVILEVVHPESAEKFSLDARVVMVAPEGVGLEVLLPDQTSTKLHTFARPKASVRAPAQAMQWVRELPAAKRVKLARMGERQERVALERAFGKEVWAPLLQNPKITVPEVAGIARKGTAPRPLIEQITLNATWMSSQLVRRALLGNPRLSSDGIVRVLRRMPRNEVKVISRQKTFSVAVREAAKKIL